MWYPFKFWRNVGYMYLCGDLAELFGQGERRYGRRFRRAVDVATTRDAVFELAMPDDAWGHVGIEGWSTTPDQVFDSLTAHFVNGSRIDLWVQTSRRSRGALGFFNDVPAETSLLVGASSVVDGRIVDIGYLPGKLREPPPIVGFISHRPSRWALYSAGSMHWSAPGAGFGFKTRGPLPNPDPAASVVR